MMVARYSIPAPPPALGRSKVSHKLQLSPRERLKLRLTVFAFFFACSTSLFFLVYVVSSPEGSPTLHDDYHTHDIISAFDKPSSIAAEPLSSHWAYYSPYHPAGKFKGSTPKGCAVSQVNILQRHGARYPTSGLTETIVKALDKLQAATSYDDPKLKFMKKYAYHLGMDDLVKYGADQSHALGVETFKRYRSLLSESGDIPFVRSAGSKRVVLSARNWTVGFSTASKGTATVNLIIPETPGSNNTLGNKMCPAATSSRHEMKQFINIAVRPIADRLNSAAPGANLDPQDAYAIMHLCPFETVAKEKISPFCFLFSKEDFKIYEYAGDLEKFYNTGYGGPLGAVQGVGYVNELIGRLTNSPAHHGLQTNGTLLSSPTTFPLNRTMYVDFSHDNLMVAVFAAMGLFNQTSGPLDPTRITKDRTWIASDMVPFSGHMTVERLSCSSRPSSPATPKSRPMRFWKADYDREDKEEYVRIFVNDARQPLEFCGAGEDGMCELQEFVKSQEYARNDGFGDFERCKYTGK